MIIALGETIVITGATTAELELDAARARRVRARLPRDGGDVVALLRLRRRDRRSAGSRSRADRTLLARDGYTYLHVVLVAGIIVGAVGDELVIAHPTDVLPAEEVVAVVAGPASTCSGTSLFRLVMAGSLSGKRLAGAIACVAVGLIGLVVPALVLAALLVGVLRRGDRVRARGGAPPRCPPASVERSGSSRDCRSRRLEPAAPACGSTTSAARIGTTSDERSMPGRGLPLGSPARRRLPSERGPGVRDGHLPDE